MQRHHQRAIFHQRVSGGGHGEELTDDKLTTIKHADSPSCYEDALDKVYRGFPVKASRHHGHLGAISVCSRDGKGTGPWRMRPPGWRGSSQPASSAQIGNSREQHSSGPILLLKLVSAALLFYFPFDETRYLDQTSGSGWQSSVALPRGLTHNRCRPSGPSRPSSTLSEARTLFPP